MKDRDLNLLLKGQAEALGLCDKFREIWRDDFTRQDLISLYKRGIEFCLDYDFPNEDFIEANFDARLLEKNNIYTRKFGVVDNGNGVYVCNGGSDGVLRFTGMDVATVYIRGGSHIRIIASDISKVFIDVLDESKVKVEQNNSAAVFIYKKSKAATLETSGKVMVRRRG